MIMYPEKCISFFAMLNYGFGSNSDNKTNNFLPQ